MNDPIITQKRYEGPDNLEGFRKEGDLSIFNREEHLQGERRWHEAYQWGKRPAYPDRGRTLLKRACFRSVDIEEGNIGRRQDKCKEPSKVCYRY